MSDIKVIKPSFEILEPSMSPTKKVAKMTRICYRSEAAASEEADANLIKNCIRRTHRSVLEHGFVSCIFAGSPIDPEKLKVFGEYKDARITSDAIWNNFDSPDRRKYVEVYGDDEIYKMIDGAGAPQKTYDCYAANFHTWLRILDDYLSAALQRKFTLGTAFMLTLITRMHNAFPEVFELLYNTIDEALGQVPKNSGFFKLCYPNGAPDDTKLCIKSFEQFFPLFDMIVAPSCGRMTFSAILRTDRAVTHELVRHRRGVAYSQESQRYVNYQNKGYEVVWPQMDPVKYEKYKFMSVPHIKDGDTEATSEPLTILDGGYLPEKSSVFNTWQAAMELAASQYEAMRSIVLEEKPDGSGKDVEVINIPPEVARTVLPNSFATTIGVTWTPATFANLMYRRLDKDAQYPIRSLIGRVVIEALKNKHPFFENFPPSLVRRWIDNAQKFKILTDANLATELINYQNKRQENIEKQISDALKKAKEKYEADEKARKERLAKKALEEANKKEAEAATPAPSAPSETK